MPGSSTPRSYRTATATVSMARSFMRRERCSRTTSRLPPPTPTAMRIIAIAARDAAGLTVIDNWSSFGQRTTASGTVLIEGVLVAPLGVFPAQRPMMHRPRTAPSRRSCSRGDAGIGRAALADTIDFVRRFTRPWIDSGQDRATDDPYTIAQIGDLTLRQNAADALLARAGRAVDTRLPSRMTRLSHSPPSLSRKHGPRHRGRADSPPISCMSLRARDRLWRSTISIGIGAMSAPTRCMIQCGGNIFMSAIMH